MLEQPQDEEEVAEQDDLYEWLVDHTPDTTSNRGITARECTDRFGKLSIERVSNILSRLKAMGVLSRRKNADHDYEYFRLMGVQESKITYLKVKLEIAKKARDRFKTSLLVQARSLREIAKNRDPACVLVLCSCGKLNKIHLTARGIEDE